MIGQGRDKELGNWFKPMAKYVYVFLTLIVFIACILFGGIG